MRSIGEEAGEGIYISPALSIKYCESLRHGEDVRVLEEEGNCIVCLEMRADVLIRRLISGELTNYSVVRTSLEPLQKMIRYFDEGLQLSRTLPPSQTCYDVLILLEKHNNHSWLLTGFGVMFYTSAGLLNSKCEGEANFPEDTTSEQFPRQSFTSTLNPPISYLATREKLS
jgi:hypothetical protein